MSKMGIKEAYIVMQKASGIKVGDTCRILRPNSSNELGSETFFHTKEEIECHPVGVVGVIKKQAIVLDFSDGHGFVIPFFVLEVVESAKVIRRVVTFIDEDGKDVTSEISDETKSNLK